MEEEKKRQPLKGAISQIRKSKRRVKLDYEMLGLIREASKPLSIERALEACNRILETAVMLKQEFRVESKIGDLHDLI